MYKLILHHNFSAAHQLSSAYSEECNNFLHGHNWKVKVEIEADYLINGMIVDFKELKNVINRLDHKNLMTDVFDITFEPTAENLSVYLHNKINEVLTKRYKDESQKPAWYEGEEPFKVTITLWEADNASIQYCN